MKQQLKSMNIYIYIYLYKETKTEAYYARKQETKLNKLGLGFLGRIMCMHEQACVRIIKPTYVAKNMHMWVLA